MRSQKAQNDFLPAKTGDFKKVTALSLKLISRTGKDIFLSPYSLIPFISQALGLNTPLMGSGNSPYSIISEAFSLLKEKKSYEELFRLDIAAKRKIVDEMYEMIAPVLLGEENEYISLVLAARYKPLIKDKGGASVERSLREKFRIFSSFLGQFKNRKKADFAHIVHYGYLPDLYREFGFLEHMPARDSKHWRDYSYPVVNELVVRGFPGEKKEIRGWVVFIANYTGELLENSRLRKRKILQAAQLARKLGAKIVGMGGLVASFAQGGRWLSEQIPEIGFTTGHAYTIGNIIGIMENVCRETGINPEKASIAVVGAAGSIGSGCVKLLAEKKPARMILIDLNTFNAVNKLKELELYAAQRSKTKVTSEFSIKQIKQADIVIVATNSTRSIIKAEDLKKGAIVIDDSFPKNIGKNILKRRRDVILLEGGIMKLPGTVELFTARNMPDLMDAPLTRAVSCKEIYGCVAETFLLSLLNWKKNYGLGSAEPALAKEMIGKGRSKGFSLAPLQCFDEAVERERIEERKKRDSL